MKRLLFRLPIALLLLLNVGVVAQQADSVVPDLFSLSLEELLNVKVAVGSRIEGLGTKELPAEITTISREDIRLSGARNLSELLSLMVPGAMGIFDADDNIFGFRGIAPDNNSMVKLLVNGQDVGFSANQNSSSMMALLDLNFIDRMEVITGPGSSIFGSGPLLGVINIITTPDKNGKKSDVYIGSRYGTGKFLDNYGHASVTTDNGLEITSSIASFSQMDGYKPRAGTSDWKLPAMVVADDKYHESYPGYSFFTNIGKGDTKVSMYSTKFVWDNYAAGTSRQMKDMRTVGAMGSTKVKLAPWMELQPSVFVKDIYLQSVLSPVSPMECADYGDELNVGSELKLFMNGRRLKTVVGTIFNHHVYGYNTYGGSNSLYIGKSTLAYDQQGNLVEHGDYVQMVDKKEVSDVDLFAESRYTLSGHYSVHASALLSYDGAMKKTNFGPRLALMTNYGGYYGKLIYTHAFRTPIAMAVGDLPAGAFFSHYINRELKTQTVDDLEAHVGFSNDAGLAQVVCFYNMNDGIILAGSFPELAPGFDPSKWKWTFANGGNVNTYGAEVSAEWNVGKNVKLRASHSIVKVAKVTYEKYLKGELYTDFEGKHLFSYPENVTKLNVTVSPTRNLALRSDCIVDYGRYRSVVVKANSIDDPAMQLSGLPNKSGNWYNINLGLSYLVFKRLRVSFNCYNVLDSRPYQVVINSSQVSTPYPRSYIGGLEYIF